MKKILSLLMVLALSFSIIACKADEEPKAPEEVGEVEQEEVEQTELVVSAAASLTDAMGEIAELIEQEENITLVSTFDSSGTLQKQIEEGAISDVFISAGQKQMDALEEQDLIDESSRIDLLTNRLVLIVPEKNQAEISNIQDVVDKKVQIAIAETETVPVGQYSKKALIDLDLWDKLDTDNVINSSNVSEVLKHVEDGNVAAGLVYTSDAVRGEGVEEVEIFDEALHGPIIYPAAIVESSQEKQAAQTFLDFLKRDDVVEIFERYGFTIKD